MVITTKIKELQYYNKYNEVFVLSLLILFTNIICKFIFKKLAEKSQRKEKIFHMKKVNKKTVKKVATLGLAAVMGISSLSLTACGSSASNDQVIIFVEGVDTFRGGKYTHIIFPKVVDEQCSLGSVPP